MGSVRKQLYSDGYVDIPYTDPSVSTLHLAQEIANSIEATAAESTEDLNASALGSKPLNTYGGNYGCGELPLHTDLSHWYRPPRYLLLRCIDGSPLVATRLLNHRQLEKWISPSVMRRALFSPRRRLEGKMYLLRMLTEELFRWDPLFLKAQNKSALEVTRLIQEAGPKMPVTDILLSRPGHTLLIDNWKYLHGRSAVPADAVGRKVERVYLETALHGH
jgi:L-asparagine oxygenase